LKIYNINRQNEYPDNYDFLDERTKKDILTYMNDQQALANSYYEKHITYAEEMKDEYLNLYDHQLDLMCGAKNVLTLMGIRLEYNWSTSPKKWILATKEDWQKREDEVEKSCQERTKMLESYSGWPKPRTNTDMGRDKSVFPRVHF